MFATWSELGSRQIIRHLTRGLSDTVTVRVTQGEVRGARTKTRTGTEFVSFKGIPYAKPPVGALRFKAPQPVEPWVGVRDALVEGSVCPQRCLFRQDIRGSEDCLNLNVYTPQVPGGADSPKKAVMIWIHGGAFITGSGNSDIYGPDLIVKEDVILVTINYRFGLFGFLSMEEAGVSGNAGMKDQVAAIRWVKNNIEAFGGDSDNITLWGESAGAISVQYHMMSSMTKGLFNKGISLSGAVLNPFAFMDTETSHRRAFRLGEALGCKTDNPGELVDHLRKQPANAIAEHLNKALEKLSNKRGEAFPFLPTIEKNPQLDGEVFLTDNPVRLLLAGRFQRMPYMLGSNNYEGILMIRNVINDPKTWKMMDKDFEQCITLPLDLAIPRYSEVSLALAEKVKRYYFGDEPLSEKHVLNYARLASDIFFTTGLYHTMKVHAQKSSYPTYYYEFSVNGSLGLFKKFLKAKGLPGASHGDILGYLFPHFMLNHELNPDSLEMKTISRMTKLVANFAKTSNPTPESDPELDHVQWEPATEANKYAYLSIDNELVMRAEREKERMEFWEAVYKQYGNKHVTKTKN